MTRSSKLIATLPWPRAARPPTERRHLDPSRRKAEKGWRKRESLLASGASRGTAAATGSQGSALAKTRGRPREKWCPESCDFHRGQGGRKLLIERTPNRCDGTGTSRIMSGSQSRRHVRTF